MVDKKKESRARIIQARENFRLSDAEMARLLVGEGVGAKNTYNKWVPKDENSKQLRKASDAVIRHIETLELVKKTAPITFQIICNRIIKSH